MSSSTEAGLASIATKYNLPRNQAQDGLVMSKIASLLGHLNFIPSPELYQLALDNEALLERPSEPKGPAADYNTEANAQAQAKTAAEQESKNRRAWVRDILPKYDLIDNEANFQMCVDYAGGELTLAKVEFLLANTPKGFKLLFGDERKSLLEQIRERLTDPYGRRMNYHDLETWMKKFSVMSRMELRAKLLEITERQETAGKPVGQIKEELAAIRRQQAEATAGFEDAHGMLWPKLLSTIVLPGTVTAVSTAEHLRSLLRGRNAESTHELKRMVRLYGDQQVNQLLQS